MAKNTKGKPQSAQSPKSSQLKDKLDFIPEPSKQVLSRMNKDGSVAIIRLDSDQYFYTLDGVSAEVWSSMDGKKTLARIVASLIKKHGLPEERFVKDVNKLISDLRKERLLLPDARTR